MCDVFVGVCVCRCMCVEVYVCAGVGVGVYVPCCARIVVSMCPQCHGFHVSMCVCMNSVCVRVCSVRVCVLTVRCVLCSSARCTLIL